MRDMSIIKEKMMAALDRELINARENGLNVERHRMLMEYDIGCQVYERLSNGETACCDGTFRHTTAVLEELGIPVEISLRNLRANRAHCDCMVVTNINP